MKWKSQSYSMKDMGWAIFIRAMHNRHICANHSGCLDWFFFLPLMHPQVSKASTELKFEDLVRSDLNNFWKNVKIEKKVSQKTFFLTVFQRLFNFTSILVHPTSKFIWGIFLHPWDSWGWFNSGDSIVTWLVLILCDSGNALVDFFTFMKMLPNVDFISIKYGH